MRKLSITKLILAAGALLALVSSCGGGGASAGIPGPGAPSGPAPGTADLVGQLVQSGPQRVTAAAGDGISGLPVALLNSLTGQLMGSQNTDAQGRFEFKAVPSGQTYLVKVEFTSSQDLDGDGSLDQIELFFPLALADQTVAQLVQRIGLTDTNSDNRPDCVEVRTEVFDDNGRSENHHRQHRRSEGRTFEDSNGDGVIDSRDRSFDDGNGNGLDDRAGEVELRGNIEALTDSIVTVAGVTFTHTAATEWQVGENHHASPSQFSVGQWVKIEGFTSSNGTLIAHEVKDSAADNSGGGGGGSNDNMPGEIERRANIEVLTDSTITVGGLTFTHTAMTEWQVGENHHASPSQFSVGQWVKVEGFRDADGVLIAREVKDAAADSSGGGGGDDDDDDRDDDDDDDDD